MAKITDKDTKEIAARQTAAACGRLIYCPHCNLMHDDWWEDIALWEYICEKCGEKRTQKHIDYYQLEKKFIQRLPSKHEKTMIEKGKLATTMPDTPKRGGWLTTRQAYLTVLANTVPPTAPEK